VKAAAAGNEESGTPHLFAALLACAVACAMLCGGRALALQVEQRHLRDIAPERFPVKDQGLVFQRAAARAPNIFPLYGSSELVKGADNKAADVFRTAPTGFMTSPVGAGGTTSIIILQKLAALGSALKGKKIAISLSPSWFLRLTVSPHFYAGNFSPMAASAMIFNHNLSADLKRDIAARMLEFPDSLAQAPVLELALTCLASRNPIYRACSWGLWPLGKLQNIVFDLQDHFEAVMRIWGASKEKPRHHALPVNPDNLSATAAALPKPVKERISQAPALDDEVREGGTAAFLDHMSRASEWKDFELLLRTLTELRAHPVLLCIPLDGPSYAEVGISRSARHQFYTTLESYCDRYHFPLIDFEGQEENPEFLELHHYHLTQTGWTFYNRALDAFYHDQPLNRDGSAVPNHP
jgi:D-alanine transfer protein